MGSSLVAKIGLVTAFRPGVVTPELWMNLRIRFGQCRSIELFILVFV